MAYMLPPIIEENSSNAEKKVFQWLSEYKDDSVLVLHSLCLPDHVNKVIGEVDFVLISQEGVLCIEVKGGRVYRENGVWIFEDRYGRKNTKAEGPFRQAEGNSQSLKKYFKNLYDEKNSSGRQTPEISILKNLSSCVYASCVMMPDCTIDLKTEEVISDILFDHTNSKNDLEVFFRRSYKYWKDILKEKYGIQCQNLSNDSIQAAKKILRDDFNYVPRISTQINRIDEELVSLTQSQFKVLKQTGSNDRLLVEGSAGTGKTLLAVEQAKRLAENGELKVLYLCKNRVLADYLREYFKSDGKFDIYNIDSYLVKMCGKPVSHPHGIFGENQDDFFKRLPQTFLKKLEAETDRNQYTYDAVIIDEGQDLINIDYYDCINAMIRGGFKEGRWSVYMDRLQNILNRDKRKQYEEYDLLIEEGSPARYSLYDNCRNTRQVMEQNFIHTGLEQGEPLMLTGMEVEFRSYADLREEREKVFETLRKLLSDGTEKRDIVLLSRYRMDNDRSCLCQAQIPKDIGEIRNNPDNDFVQNSISYYTIHSFKGLDSKVVLMLDVDGFQTENDRRLNYVGMSRAKVLLYVFYPKAKEEERKSVMDEIAQKK